VQKRKDFGTTADSFFDDLAETVAPLARELRGVIRKAMPDATESIKWGMPVYESSRLVCAIRPAAGYVALQFYEGATALPDPDGLLEGTGKTMRHVKIRSKTDIRKKLFTDWIRQAAGAA
jgi:hypothetical protein